MLEQIKKKPMPTLNTNDIRLLQSKGYKIIKSNNKVIAIVKSFK